MREYFEFDQGGIYHIVSPSASLATQAIIKSAGYFLKSDHHITLIGAKYSSLLDNEQIGAVSRIIKSGVPFEYRLNDTLYAVTKPKIVDGKKYDRDSLVALVDSPRLVDVLSKIISSFGLDVPQQLLHVTVATRPDTDIARRGIAINSLEELQSLEPKLFCKKWMAK